MKKTYLHLLGTFFLLLSLAGCSKEELTMPDDERHGKELPVEFQISIAEDVATRGLLKESKQAFTSGDLIHLQVIYKLEDDPYEKRLYTILQCTSTTTSNGNIRYVRWSVRAGSPQLSWPDNAISASFTAYYIAGTTGALSGNTMQAKLLSDYKPKEIPLFAEAKDVGYGEAVILDMTRIFSVFRVTDIREGISNNMWFTLPEAERKDLHNAFRLKFDEGTYDMTPEFITVHDDTYMESDGTTGLVRIATCKFEEEEPDEAGSISFFLQPGVYNGFCILYPRTRTTYNTYLSYNRSLAEMVKAEDKTNTTGAFLPNGRYVFSVLRSLGVIVEKEPEDGWDNSEPDGNFDVEKFLRAVHAGSAYEENGVQYLEQIEGGTRLVRNISFRNTYYETFGEDNFRPAVDNKIFDGDYHYIYDVGCPVFYQNNSLITNVGFRNVKTTTAIVSRQPETHEKKIDMSVNGIIVSKNTQNATVSNVRVINADVTVEIDTYPSSQEAHTASLLFGSNEGRIFDVGLAGDLNFTVKNADGETVIPRVTIGGVVGQNVGTISGLTYITDDKETDLEMPVITIKNLCDGDNGVYYMGGLAGNNTGTLADLFVPDVRVDAIQSRGVVSYLGGLIGTCEGSSAGAAQVSGCMVGGEVRAGTIGTSKNVTSNSYTGGVAGVWNAQAIIADCSVAVDVYDESERDSETEYAQGGAFGHISPLAANSGHVNGTITGFTCFSSFLKGNGLVGNVAGIVPAGYGWEETYWQNADIQFKKHAGVDNPIGRVNEN